MLRILSFGGGLSVLVIPAIDIKDGRCVRLYQGDYRQVTVFAKHPADIARRWQEQGAERIHVVDLDGAAKGSPVNTDAIRDIIGEVTVPVQVGGGIRSLSTISRLLALRVDRVILGTAAVEDFDLVATAVARWRDRIAIGIDARDGLAATHGWKTTSSRRALDLAVEMVGLGVSRIVYTDISRDGTLTEPNYTATAELVAAVPVPIIASGGVTSIDQLRKLEAVGVEGAIVGRALYTGGIDLREALSALKEG